MTPDVPKPGHLSTVCVVASILSLACATTPPPQMTVGTRLTDVEGVGRTPATQTNGGVTITVAPVAFDTTRRTVCSYERAGPSVFQSVPDDVSEETHTRLEEETFQVLSAQPTELTFLLTIRNQMDRVFRGSGAVVQFTADEKVQAVEQANYRNLLDALIPPGNERQIRIRGPSIDALSDGSTVGVQLFDVVTAIDSAGNVVSRDNFEWHFTIQNETIRQTLETIDSRRTFWAPDARAEALLSRSLDDPSVQSVRLVRPDGTTLKTVKPASCYGG